MTTLHVTVNKGALEVTQTGQLREVRVQAFVMSVSESVRLIMRTTVVYMEA